MANLRNFVCATLTKHYSYEYSVRALLLWRARIPTRSWRSAGSRSCSKIGLIYLGGERPLNLAHQFPHALTSDCVMDLVFRLGQSFHTDGVDFIDVMSA